jgi:hypothetical protein
MVTVKRAGKLVGSDNLKPKKEKKAKEGPKRALSAYILFCNDKREEVTAEGLKGKEVMRELGKRWKDLDEEGKQPYVTANEEAKAKLEAEAEATAKPKPRAKSPKGKAANSRSLSPPKGKAKAMDESMGDEEKPKRGRKKGGC